MVTLHLLFGKLAWRGVKFSLAKDFHYHQGGFMGSLENGWNSHKLQDDTFAGDPTNVKMPEDYVKDIQRQGLLNPPENDVEDCQLLFACACRTMLGYHGNQLCGGLLVYVLFLVDEPF